MSSEQYGEIMDLIQQHRNLIYKVANAYCSNKMDFEDLVQEIIIQMITSYERFDHQVKATTWMYQLAIHVSISFTRKQNTQTKHFAPWNEQLIHIKEESAEELNENLELLNSFINELPSIKKGIMILYLDGLDHDEIASIIGISKTNVGTQINRIKKELSKKFNLQ
tara:strand:+ start:671 stop:1168 length:498 start_codon:yes stop_codon:yes gene_type:complete